MKNLDFNSIVFASLLFLPSLFFSENILEKVFWKVLYGIVFFLCLYSLIIKRKNETLYKYYFFKFLALVYILSFSYIWCNDVWLTN